jgi:hypothetical protein
MRVGIGGEAAPIFLCLAIAILIQREQTQAVGCTPVVVELFTSEGCSSCPPADELLTELGKTQVISGAEIIPLELHVDYWNELGWADPFSSSLFSERQNTYARSFGNGRIYTPQMIVDGRAEFVGSNSGQAYETIRRAAQVPKAVIQINASTDGSESSKRSVPLRIQLQGLASVIREETADLLLAITEDGLSSKVLRGENRGRKLSHTGVVRRLDVIGKVNPGQPDAFSVLTTAYLEDGWKREHLRAVVWLQERSRKRIVGAASSPL